MPSKSDRFRAREIAVGKGRLRTADDPATIGPEDVSVAINLRPSDQYHRGIAGMTEINTTALSSTGIRNMYHFRKSLPVESHVMAWTSDGKVWVNDTTIPNQGAFDATALFTDTLGGTTGRFAHAPGGALAYANGKEACLWGGDEHRCSGFIDIPETGKVYDYGDLITNTKTDANNLATIHTAQGTDTDTALLLHLDNNVTDSSATTPHTVTNSNVSFTAPAKFGTHAAEFNGTSARLTIPDDADFNFSAGTWTIDFWAFLNSTPSSTNEPIYYHGTNASNYMRIYFTTNGYGYGTLNLEIKATTTVVTLTSSSIYTYAYAHYEIVESGDNYYMFRNGTLIGSTTDTDRPVDYSGTIYIGNDGSTNWFKGWIDEYRVSTVARHTSSFSPPSVAYGAGYSSTTYIGSIMPLDGVKFTVATGNPLSSGTATMQMSEWDGSAWSELTITDNTAASSRALEQTGTVTWASTAATSIPTVVEKAYLYWYKMVITGAADFGGITLSQVTVSIPFQALKDLWDGEERPLNSVMGYKSSVYYDFTSNVLENGYSSTGTEADAATYAKLDGYTSSDYLFVGCMERLSGLIFNLIDKNVNVLDSLMSVSYWNGDEWTALTISDGTLNGSKTLGRSGWVTWGAQDRADEQKKSDLGSTSVKGQLGFQPYNMATFIATGEPGYIGRGPDTAGVKTANTMYYYRVGFSATITNPTNIYHIAGIPVPRDIRGYSFPAFHQNRVVLVSNTDGAKNTILMSAFNHPNTFNGLDAYEFALGQEEEINAGASLFLRFGSAVQDMLLLTKPGEIHLLEGNGSDSDVYRTRLLSSAVGCRAPLTMATIPVGDLGGGVRRQIVVWESQRGIEVFDGSALLDPLLSHDIRDKFDPNHENYAGSSSNTGFYDPVYDEYHWCPVGTAEWVFSFKYKKWYQVVRGEGKYLYGGTSVMDTSGNSYIYGFDTAGYVYRLENGTDFDGNDIIHTIKTGDIALNQNQISEETTLRMVKVVQVSKNTTANSMAVTHYGDTDTIGNSLGSFSPADSKRLKTRILNAGSKGPHVHHEFQLSLTTDDETCGCEPIYIVAYYDGERQDVR
jgi:hypothetical protein